MDILVGWQKGFPVALPPPIATTSRERERVQLISRVVIPLPATVVGLGGGEKLRYLPHPYTISVKSTHLARRSRRAMMAMHVDSAENDSGERQRTRLEVGAAATTRAGLGSIIQRESRIPTTLRTEYGSSRVPIGRLHAIPSGCQRKRFIKAFQSTQAVIRTIIYRVTSRKTPGTSSI